MINETDNCTDDRHDVNGRTKDKHMKYEMMVVIWDLEIIICNKILDQLIRYRLNCNEIQWMLYSQTITTLMTCKVNDEIDIEHHNYNDDWRKVKL